MVQWLQRKALVIDDIGQMRTNLIAILGSIGITRADSAVNGDDALRKISSEFYDLILCDYNLGRGRNGQQVLEEARENELLPYSTVFMMVTAETRSPMVSSAAEYSPDEYLVKPFTGEALRLRLERQFDRKGQFIAIDQAIANDQWQLALKRVDEIILRKDKKSWLDAQRLKAELLIRLADYATAATIYNEVQTERDFNWAELGLAKIDWLESRDEAVIARMQKLIAREPSLVRAYELLARAQQRQGQLKDAQATLEKATGISPRSVRLHKRLGNVALNNGDLERAEGSMRAAVDIGKYSVHRDVADYTKLANVLTTKGDGEGALNFLKEASRSFTQTAAVKVQLALSQANALQRTGNSELAARQFAVALENYSAAADALDEEAKFAMVAACLGNGEQAQAEAIAREVVKNNHDNPQILQAAKRVFDQHQLGAIGQQLVEQTSQEVIGLNNRAVELARGGDLQASLDLFIQAADALKQNRVITMNAAQALVAFMQKQGANPEYTTLLDTYLERVRQLDPHHPKLTKLLEVRRRLLRQTGGQ